MLSVIEFVIFIKKLDYVVPYNFLENFNDVGGEGNRSVIGRKSLMSSLMDWDNVGFLQLIRSISLVKAFSPKMKKRFCQGLFTLFEENGC